MGLPACPSELLAKARGMVDARLHALEQLALEEPSYRQLRRIMELRVALSAIREAEVLVIFGCTEENGPASGTRKT